MNRTWWKEGVIYQIYPRSFYDANQDGIGDLNGILQKLPHLKQLGVDIIWLSPIYQSPNDDNGYDISDYYNIMTEFGTMEDFDRLLDAIHGHGLKLVMDLVVNHSSDEHKWFQESRKSKDNPYRDYYTWHPPVNGGPPSNWKSFFSGSAWTLDENTGEYYLHLFSVKQPDLNWENPKVRHEVYDLMRFWLDKGIDGFRMDVIPFLSKPPGFPDKDWDNIEDYGKAYANGPRIHEFLHEMHEEVLKHYDVMTIGEGVGITKDQANLYVGEDREELNMIFHFDHMFIDHGKNGRMDPHPYTLEEFLDVFDSWEEALGDRGWGSVYLGNHDFPRLASRFGDSDNYHSESSKLLSTLLLTRKGTPCIYQGDEIGMTNVNFTSVDEYRDIELHNAYKELVVHNGMDTPTFLKTARKQARDHARTPVQWANQPNGGFTNETPWIKANPNYPQINVEIQDNEPLSILNYYRDMIKIRKSSMAWVYGKTEVLTERGSTVYAYRRSYEGESFVVVLNFSGESQSMPIEVSGMSIMKGNYNSGEEGNLQPWEARIYRA